MRRVARTGGDSVFVKTYDYPTWTSRLRDFGRRTAPWGTPRPHREFDALAWLRAHGCPGPEPLAVLVHRAAGFVARAILVTEAFPGAPADAVLPQLSPPERIGAARAIIGFVHGVHALGFRDRNLDLRNLLVARGPSGWSVAKIDSPRFRLCAPGPAIDRRARADWQRLAPQLRAAGVDPAAAGAPPAATPA